jgi:hypothetical protein
MCALFDDGFVVIPGPVPQESLASLAYWYDHATLSAPPTDVAVGRSTTRVTDFVNRGPVFDDLYIHAHALEA